MIIYIHNIYIYISLPIPFTDFLHLPVDCAAFQLLHIHISVVMIWLFQVIPWTRAAGFYTFSEQLLRQAAVREVGILSKVAQNPSKSK